MNQIKNLVQIGCTAIRKRTSGAELEGQCSRCARSGDVDECETWRIANDLKKVFRER